MRLRNYKPKYSTIELINASDGTMMLIDFNEAVKLWGGYFVRSVRDYDRTKTTSIIVTRGKSGYDKTPVRK